MLIKGNSTVSAALLIDNMRKALQWIAMANSSLHGYDDLRIKARIALDLDRLASQSDAEVKS